MTDYYGPNDKTPVQNVGQSHITQAIMAERYGHWGTAQEHWASALNEYCRVRDFMESQRFEMIKRIRESDEKRDKENA